MAAAWCVYLLSNGARTYIGASTDVARRVRQHNGELAGGARATSAHRRTEPWRAVAWLTGFADKRAALRWERIVKCRATGLARRLNAMRALAAGTCPTTGRARERAYTVPPGLLLHTA